MKVMAIEKTTTEYHLPNYTIIHPGKCVSINHLESLTLGLIAQLKSMIPMTQIYNSATVLVDHRSRLTYVSPSKVAHIG